LVLLRERQVYVRVTLVAEEPGQPSGQPNDEDSFNAKELSRTVYNEILKIAAAKLSHEKPGQTLQPGDLAHEVLIKRGLVEQKWDNRAHFFGAVAEAMRRFLVNRARKKRRLRHGGDLLRVDSDKIDVAREEEEDTTLFVDQALKQLATIDPICAELVNLRFFAGISSKDAAQALGLSERTAKRKMAYARAWLKRELMRLHAGGDDSATEVLVSWRV